MGEPVNVHIIGVISHMTYANFRQMMVVAYNLGRPVTVALDSHGGDAVASFKIARLINTFKANTHVQNQCNSAAVNIFVAGYTRTASPFVDCGIHAITANSQETEMNEYSRKLIESVFIGDSTELDEAFANKIDLKFFLPTETNGFLTGAPGDLPQNVENWFCSNE